MDHGIRLNTINLNEFEDISASCPYVASWRYTPYNPISEYKYSMLGSHNKPDAIDGDWCSTFSIIFL